MIFWKRDKRRRQFFIKKEFQGKFILLYTLCVIVPAGLSVLFLYGQARTELEKNYYSSHLKISNTGEIFQWLLISTNLVSTAILVLLVVLLSLYIFRRLNTHFHRMEERFVAMSQGDFSPAPQPSSHFQEVSTLIELSEQTRQDYHQRFREMDLLLSRLDAALAAGGTIFELRELARELGQQLSRVKLPERSFRS